MKELKLKHLSYHHPHPLIENISLTFQTGVLYGILGPNGSGKSTLLKTIARIWNPTQGELIWQGLDLLKFSRLEMSRTISFVAQHPSPYFDLPVYQMVSLGRYMYGRHSKETQSIVDDVLHQVNVWHLRHQLLSQLSGGERQRVYIARALATQAPILLLDEPTSSLDLRHQLDIWHLLRQLVNLNHLVIVAIHDLTAAQRFCDELVVLNQGRCQIMGKPQNVLKPSLMHDVFHITDSEILDSFQSRNNNG